MPNSTVNTKNSNIISGRKQLQLFKCLFIFVLHMCIIAFYQKIFILYIMIFKDIFEYKMNKGCIMIFIIAKMVHIFCFSWFNNSGNFEKLKISETSKNILSLIKMKLKHEITNNRMK